MIWVFLELSSFRFLILSKNKNSRESLLKYFLIQTIRSIFILTSILRKLNIKSTLKVTSLQRFPILFIRMIVKRGLAPLHFWIIKVREGLNNKIITIFLSIQKIAPLSIIIIITNSYILQIILITSSIVGTISQITTMNLNILLTYSSVAHSSWILICGIKNMIILFTYITIYILLISQIFFIIKKINLKYISNIINNISILILILRLAGLPPLLGFFPKWIALLNTIKNLNQKITCIILIIMACLNIYIYIRLIFSKNLKSYSNKNLKTKNEESFFSCIITNSLSIPTILLFSK
jgi:NADH:ubiquinone oxidoreductase subunit 2 (subunit N)